MRFESDPVALRRRASRPRKTAAEQPSMEEPGGWEWSERITGWNVAAAARGLASSRLEP